MQKRGYSADGLHGDLSQNQRDAVMRKFRDGSIDVLVATDVAARGLDVSGVTHVVNFDLPQDPESYVHRIGRTGRAGKEGKAWSFVTPREIDHLHFIEKVTRQKMVKKPLPSLSEAIEGKQRITAERVIELVDNDNFAEYKGLSIQLLEQYDSVQLLAAALKLLTGDKKEVNIELTPEEPLRAKKRRPDVRSNGRPFNRSGNGSGGGYRGGNNGSRDRRPGGGYKGNNSEGSKDGARGGYGKRSNNEGRSDQRRSSENRRPRPNTTTSND